MSSPQVIKGSLAEGIIELLSRHQRLHGFEIAKALKHQQKVNKKDAEGAVYPVLVRLTQAGILSRKTEQEGNRSRYYYALTQKGRGTHATSLTPLETLWFSLKQMIDPMAALDIIH